MNLKKILLVSFLSIISLLIVWFPFFSHFDRFLGINFASTGMDRVVSNFDGINFLIVAKSWYDPDLIQSTYQDVLSGRRPLYFAAHYPVFPLLISFFDIFLSGPHALLASIVLSNVLLAVVLYYFFLMLGKSSSTALFLTTIALFFPARMLGVRAVGSNEPLFIAFILSSLIFFEKKRNILSALLASLAVLTRSPGILLFFAYILYFLRLESSFFEKLKQIFPYLMVPTSLVGLWAFYGVKFGSFWAYFQVGGNLNIYWPFSVLSSQMDWVSGIWNEDLIYLFCLLLIGTLLYVRKIKWHPSSIYLIIYSFFIVTVAHRDLARYSLPIMPLILFGIRDLFEIKYVKYILLVLLIPIFLYTWQFVLANYQPIVDWSKYL